MAASPRPRMSNAAVRVGLGEIADGGEAVVVALQRSVHPGRVAQREIRRPHPEPAVAERDLGSRERQHRAGHTTGGHEGQFGRAVVLGDRDPAGQRPIGNRRRQGVAGDHRGPQRRLRRQGGEQVGQHGGDRVHSGGPSRWSVSSAPSARVCTAANRCRVACNGPVRSTRSAASMPASSANGANDDVQDAAVRITGRGRPDVPEVTTTRNAPSGKVADNRRGVRRVGEQHRHARGRRAEQPGQRGDRDAPVADTERHRRRRWRPCRPGAETRVGPGAAGDGESPVGRPSAARPEPGAAGPVGSVGIRTTLSPPAAAGSRTSRRRSGPGSIGGPA